MQQAKARVASAKAYRSTILDLSNLGITEIPYEVWDLTWLERLYIQDNPISMLPSGIGNLRNLETFDMCNTDISSIPNEIGYIREDCNWYVEADRLNDMSGLHPNCSTGDIIRYRRGFL